MELKLISFTFFASAMRYITGHPIIPSPDGPIPNLVPNRQNMTLDSVRKAYPPQKGRGENNFDPRDNLSMDKIHFIMYAGRAISVLHKDPNYADMKDKLQEPQAGTHSVYEMMGMMSEATKKKISEIKKEELTRIAKLNCPKEKRPNYLDYDHPDTFTGLDLHLLIGKVATMRHVLEEFIHGNKPKQ